MSKFATRLLMLAICATALAAVPTVTPAKAAASSSKHIKKHRRNVQRVPGFGEPWSARQAWPNYQPWPDGRSISQGGRTCFRGIDCAKWPPPIDEDPDRKVSGDGI